MLTVGSCLHNYIRAPKLGEFVKSQTDGNRDISENSIFLPESEKISYYLPSQNIITYNITLPHNLW